MTPGSGHQAAPTIILPPLLVVAIVARSIAFAVRLCCCLACYHVWSLSRFAAALADDDGNLSAAKARSGRDEAAARPGHHRRRSSRGRCHTLRCAHGLLPAPSQT